MSFSILLAVTGSASALLAVFLFIAITFLNIGIKMAQKGDVKTVKIMPTIQKKMKESPEAKATRERIELINNFNGYPVKES